MKKIVITFLLFLVLPISLLAQSNNIGIIKGIWFSEDTFFAGDPVRIYTAIQNNTGDDIEGIVEFFDNDISIGKKNFTALDRRIAEIWIDSIVSEGKHNYSVQITEAAINKPGEANEPVAPRVIESDETLVVDIDTDGDDVGDMEDTDDDNDGFSDKEEEKEGTNPLDDSSIPEKEEPKVERSDQNDDNIIQKIINEITGSNSAETTPVESSSGEFSQNNNAESADTFNPIELPSFVEKIQQEYPVVSRVSKPLNNIQNAIVPKITQEQKRIESRIRKPKVEISSDTTNTQEISEPEKKLSGWQYWMYQIYSWILFAFSWIFSCLICMIILLFIVLHIVLKIFFRIFKRRSSE